MSELTTPLRNQLAKVITKARRVSEAGAQQALESLAVERHEPHSSMTIDERALRNRLRARGRQLGDVRDRQRGNQSINRLTHEVAYEHWHRMLFARFLAENGLLIHPEHQVAMSLEEIEELAQEMGEDPHQMAAGFAQDSLPQIFRSGDPVLEVRLAPETRQKLEALLDSLPIDIFTADDSLGWTYQYWQSEKKKAVNDSGEKIGADELPAVTQLFTEHYMVMFLYHNTIGAWHAGKVLAENPELAETSRSEDELRAAVTINTSAGKSAFDYLRFVREQQDGDEEGKPTGKWQPAAGIFDGWPKTAKELKILDPCCGSGHFLVVGFKQMVRLRMHEEGLDLNDAIQVVLSDNIHGLELDQRCTQIAAFNLAIAAWKLAGKPIDLPPLNIACSGLSIASSKKDWLALAGENERLIAGLDKLYELFLKAPELGSLIDPKGLKNDMFVANFEELQPLLVEALARESDDVEETERAVAAQGMASAADLLSGEYTLVITNVPYLGRGDHSPVLTRFADAHYPRSKSDLAAMFLERCQRFPQRGGSTALVCTQNLLFLPSYTYLRKNLLSTSTLEIIAALGPKAFQSPLYDFNTMLIVQSTLPGSTDNRFSVLDASQEPGPNEKAELLFDNGISPSALIQQNQITNPKCKIVLSSVGTAAPLSDYADTYKGICAGDSPQFQFCFWELPGAQDKHKWILQQSSITPNCIHSGLHAVLLWEKGEGRFMTYIKARLGESQVGKWVRGRDAWGRSGIAIRIMGKVLPVGRYLGMPFDNNISVIVPKDPLHEGAIWAYCSSDEYSVDVRALNQKISVTDQSFIEVSFDLDRWETVASEYDLPKPQSDEPTQWLFHGHPANTNITSALQVYVGRLLGYRWPPELDTEIHLADEAREWVKRCDELQGFADEDGIVCLSATRGEASAADRLRKLLAAAFGTDWSVAKEKELLAVAGDGKKTAASLEIWLRDKFFEEHCKLFHHRPFIWHIWDGNPSGFHCLVNAHKLTGDNGEGRRTLEAIAYSYLGDWIDRQKDDQLAMVEGADARLASAQDLQQQLETILEGEPPYDLFVRWKSLQEQAIGWEPDINDGVRLNIRPFMNAELRKGGKKGAGILRWKPNIKWKKDRGKEPQSLRPKEDFPWFWGCKGDGNEDDVTDFTAKRAARADFDGNRWNDLHYSRAVKEAARDVAKEKQKEAYQ